MKNALLIQVFHSFASGVLGVVIPLMMKERNIEVVLIGFVFASMPLIMQFGRMFFATLSDFFGRKPFFIANGFLGTVSSLVYCFAYTPMEFLFGKIAEGTKEGAIWAVNRAYLLERSRGDWRTLVILRTTVYLAYATGSLAAGFLMVSIFYEGTLLLCAFLGVLGVLFSITLVDDKKGEFDMQQALRFLDFRKKNRKFKIFLFLFFMMGLSFGFRSGYVIPYFLSASGFSAETVGLIVGVMILLAGLFSYLFSKCSRVKELILISGTAYSVLLTLLGFSPPALTAVLVILVGIVEGMNSIGQEGILSKICDKESYGTDIGLLMMGLHIGEAGSLALSGVLIAKGGFAASFIPAAALYSAFYMGTFMLYEEK
ncbi:MAG: MFS transporter [Candidatus Bathyarchaeota archaeon]|nr:MFS transporter [Candidatus Bathyarchaeota archaeon]MDW8040477.1 MFS transporter [Nitrososphaerota archaeon]